MRIPVAAVLIAFAFLLARASADQPGAPRTKFPAGTPKLPPGFDIDKIGDAGKERQNAAAYIELHIEQGPVLERMGLPLAVVMGTKGVERHAITFRGQEAHSGSTPMEARRDALAAAAKLALEIRPIAMKHPLAVCTMGSVKTFPGIVTAVVRRCEVTVVWAPTRLAEIANASRIGTARAAAKRGGDIMTCLARMPQNPASDLRQRDVQIVER